jgi:hypothetical protein
MTNQVASDLEIPIAITLLMFEHLSVQGRDLGCIPANVKQWFWKGVRSKCGAHHTAGTASRVAPSTLCCSRKDSSCFFSALISKDLRFVVPQLPFLAGLWMGRTQEHILFFEEDEFFSSIEIGKGSN